MTDEERTHALRGLGEYCIGRLAQGRICSCALIAAEARSGRVAISTVDELNLMLEAARDPREAAVDAEYRKICLDKAGPMR